MLVEFFNNTKNILTKKQIEQLELIEVDLIMLNYKISRSSSIIYFQVNDEIQFYIYHSEFDNSWTINDKRNYSFEEFDHLDELIDHLIKLI